MHFFLVIFARFSNIFLWKIGHKFLEHDEKWNIFFRTERSLTNKMEYLFKLLLGFSIDNSFPIILITYALGKGGREGKEEEGGGGGGG